MNKLVEETGSTLSDKPCSAKNHVRAENYWKSKCRENWRAHNDVSSLVSGYVSIRRLAVHLIAEGNCILDNTEYANI